MTHDSILALVDAVNAGTATDRIFLRPLSPQVDFARVWESEPSGRAANEGSLRVYFVRDQAGTCVGAIEDLGHDIHAVTGPAFRQLGFMKRALGEVVLPHIVSTGVHSQRTRLFSSEGKALALGLGFTLIAEDEAEIVAERVRPWVSTALPVPALATDRLAAVDARLARALGLVRAARERLDKRAGANALDQMEFAAHWIAELSDPAVAWPDDRPDTPPPTLPPLAPEAQKEVERLLYCGAGYLRMAADELDGRADDDRVARVRQLDRRLVDSTRTVRDDWRDRQFRAPPGL